MEVHLNTWDRHRKTCIAKSRRIRIRGLRGGDLKKALTDLRRTDKIRENKFGHATKSGKRLDQMIALEVVEFDNLRALSNKFANQSIEYRLFFIAGIHEVVVIRSGNVPVRQGVFRVDAEGNIEHKIAMLPGGNKQPGQQGFGGKLPTEDDVKEVKENHEENMNTLRKKINPKIEDLRDEQDALTNYLERVNG